ncbi:MAG TPA: ABC transporter ATP-binding protein [Vicinamibacterales bacterium]|nr:ABC transporter ATP-binding protein [Vicinamibacterales bacterium]
MDSAGTLTEAAALHAAVSRQYASGFVLDVKLDALVAPGAVLVLFGPSGAGKTTLLRHLAGLERAGDVRFGGAVWSDSSRGVWVTPQDRRVGLVFQEPTLFPHLSVRDNIAFGLSSGSDDAAVHRVTEVAGLLGVRPLLDRFPRSLSGGEARRVALARALAPSPRLLLLDEPFSALDAPTRARLRSDVRLLLRRTGTPAILVTHDRTEAMAMGDLTAVVIDGRIRQVGGVAEVFSRPADADVAASLGVEAVIPARIVGSDSGLLSVAVGSATLSVADRPDHERSSADVYVCIRAEDVMLEKQSPAQASARNRLPALIVSIAVEGPIERVTLDCGFIVDALITRRSSEELELKPGGVVTAAIKATSIHLVPRV